LPPKNSPFFVQAHAHAKKYKYGNGSIMLNYRPGLIILGVRSYAHASTHAIIDRDMLKRAHLKYRGFTQG